MPSTTVVDRMLSWFQVSHKGRNHGAPASVSPIPYRRGPGDRANLGLMADRSGTPYHAPLCPQRCPSSGVGLSAGLVEPRRAEKWVADRRSRWGGDPVWHPACARTLINSLEPCSATLACFLGDTEVSPPSARSRTCNIMRSQNISSCIDGLSESPCLSN